MNPMRRLCTAFMGVVPSLVACGQQESSDETVVAEQGFKVGLPGRWTRLSTSGDGKVVLRSEEHPEQLTVTILGVKERPSAGDLRPMLDRIIEHSRSAEIKSSSPSIAMGDVFHGQIGGTISARYDVVESTTHRRATRLTLCSPVGIWSFYLEAVNEAQDDFDARAKRIMNAIGVAGT